MKTSGRIAATALVILVMGTGTALAAAPGISSDNEAERSAITHVLDDEGAAWLAGDADAFAAHVLPNISFANTVGMFSIGKEAFVAQHRAIFSTIYKGSKAQQFVVAMTFLKPDVAIVDTVAKVSGARQMPTGVPAIDGVLYTRLEQVMVKQSGTWWVAAFHNVPIQPQFVTDEVRAVASGTPH